MAEAKCYRHNHHRYEERPIDAYGYSESTYGCRDGMGGYAENSYGCRDGMGGYAQNTTFAVVEEPLRDYAREEKQHKNREHLGELGAVAAGAFALYENEKAKKDKEHAQKHRIEEGLAAAAAVGAGGYAFLEYREKKEAREEEKYQQYY